MRKNAQSSAASSSLFRISSLMDPKNASLRPTDWSSNFGHRIPGVSRSSTCLFRRIHWFPLVTPGLFPVLAAAFAGELVDKRRFPHWGSLPPWPAPAGLRSRASGPARSFPYMPPGSHYGSALRKPSVGRRSLPITWKPLASKYRVSGSISGLTGQIRLIEQHHPCLSPAQIVDVRIPATG